METITSSKALSLADRLLLDEIARQLDDPNIPTRQLFEMLSELTAMGRRYEFEFSPVAG